jgi:subtilisin-like proprotein convertase family protein
MKRKKSPAGIKGLALMCLLSAAGARVPWAQPAGGGFRSFTNAAAVTIVDETSAVPYPSVIPVSGIAGVITNLSVTLRGLSHSWPDDLDVLLVGPGGQRTVLMSDAGGSFPVAGVTLTFTTSGKQLPNSTQITSGAWSPVNWGASGDNFAPPAPGGPYAVSLAAFDGTSPNGSWALYIVDDIPGNDGELSSGWSLTVATGPEPPPRLAITRISPALQLSWATNFPGYTLEGTLALEPREWGSIGNTVIVTNGQFQVLVPLSGSQQFFRLRK